MPTKILHTEDDVRSRVVKWAKAHDIGHVRMTFRPGVATGVPDDLFLLPNGWAIWCEFKAPGKKPTKRQLYKMEELERRHHLVMWGDNPEPLIAYLMKLARWERAERGD